MMLKELVIPLRNLTREELFVIWLWGDLVSAESKLLLPKFIASKVLFLLNPTDSTLTTKRTHTEPSSQIATITFFFWFELPCSDVFILVYACACQKLQQNIRRRRERGRGGEHTKKIKKIGLRFKKREFVKWKDRKEMERREDLYNCNKSRQKTVKIQIVIENLVKEVISLKSMYF